jgi:hypothetical protein
MNKQPYIFIEISNWIIIWTLALLVTISSGNMFDLVYDMVFYYTWICWVPLLYGLRWVFSLRKSVKALMFFLLNLATMPIYFYLFAEMFISHDVM